MIYTDGRPTVAHYGAERLLAMRPCGRCWEADCMGDCGYPATPLVDPAATAACDGYPALAGCELGACGGLAGDGACPLGYGRTCGGQPEAASGACCGDPGDCNECGGR